MQVGGILETALDVGDLPRASAFYRRVFGFPTLLENDRLIALDVAGRSVLLLFLRGSTEAPFPVPGTNGVIPPHGGSGRGHLAFAIGPGEADAWRARLDAEGVAVESVVDWPGGATSVYFRDPDDHLVELITPGFWATY